VKASAELQGWADSPAATILLFPTQLPTNGRFLTTSGNDPTGGVGCPTADIPSRDSAL